MLDPPPPPASLHSTCTFPSSSRYESYVVDVVVDILLLLVAILFYAHVFDRRRLCVCVRTSREIQSCFTTPNVTLRDVTWRDVTTGSTRVLLLVLSTLMISLFLFSSSIVWSRWTVLFKWNQQTATTEEVSFVSFFFFIIIIIVLCRPALIADSIYRERMKWIGFFFPRTFLYLKKIKIWYWRGEHING